MISRQDNNLDFKELEKVIPEKYRDMVIILDDNSDVWHKYRDNLVQVLPYHYWNKDTAADPVIAGPDKDCYLYYLGSFLQRAFSIYNKVKSRSVEPPRIQKVVRVLHDSVFWGKIIHFSSVFSKSSDVMSQRETRLVLSRRGTVTECPSMMNTMVVNTLKCIQFLSLGTPKIKEALSREVPVVHLLWLRYSIVYLAPLSLAFFAAKNFSEERLNDLPTLEREIIEYHSRE